jgi:hypothetical protein
VNVLSANDTLAEPKLAPCSPLRLSAGCDAAVQDAQPRGVVAHRRVEVEIAGQPVAPALGDLDREAERDVAREAARGRERRWREYHSCGPPRGARGVCFPREAPCAAGCGPLAVVSGLLMKKADGVPAVWITGVEPRGDGNARQLVRDAKRDPVR